MMRLAQLCSAELIFRRGTPPDAEYTFKHALVQDAAYSTLLAQPTPAVSRAHRHDLGEPFSRNVSTLNRHLGAALRGGRPEREGS